jgi:hypothetical protein
MPHLPQRNPPGPSGRRRTKSQRSRASSGRCVRHRAPRADLQDSMRQPLAVGVRGRTQRPRARKTGFAMFFRRSLFSMLGFAPLFASLVVACAGTDGSSQDQSPGSSEEDLTGKRCGSFVHGTCPTHYWCDMSNVPPGVVGGSGVCRKEHQCIMNGVFVCPPGETFDTSVCHCH